MKDGALMTGINYKAWFKCKHCGATKHRFGIDETDMIKYEIFNKKDIKKLEG